jgi:hypothetical protein
VKTLPPDLEALMPEPVIVGTSRFGTIFYAHPDIVMREFGRAVWEAATKRAAKLAATLAYDAAIKYANGYVVDFEDIGDAIRGTK